MEIKQITDNFEKRHVARIILEALPEWFQKSKAREKYIAASTNKIFFGAYDKKGPVGFLYLKETSKDTVELYVMGVLKDYQRQGIGRNLFQTAVITAREMGFSFIQVKTVQMGKYEQYDKTNKFYLSLGFKEFEVFPTLWGKRNPCQIYIKCL